jgi:hypothetical protein
MDYHIIFINKGFHPSLYYVLNQAKKFNARAVVDFIGDSKNKIFNFIIERAGIKYYDVNSYFKSAKEFEGCYKHISVNPYNFELIAFQRWFILRDFLTSNNIDKCLYLDSDVMLYCNVEEEFKRLGDFDFTLTKETPGDTSGAGCVFINNRGFLNHFCQFLLEFYKQKEIIITTTFDGKPHFSDMYAFELFRRQTKYKIPNLADVVGGATFDVSMLFPYPGGNLQMLSNGMKRIVWVDNSPYGVSADTDKKIRFKILHFQGYSKKYIRRYYKSTNALDIIFLVYESIYCFIQRMAYAYNIVKNRWRRIKSHILQKVKQ